MASPFVPAPRLPPTQSTGEITQDGAATPFASALCFATTQDAHSLHKTQPSECVQAGAERLVRKRTLCLSFDPSQSRRGLGGHHLPMERPIIFRCPTTGQQVQAHLSSNEP